MCEPCHSYEKLTSVNVSDSYMFTTVSLSGACQEDVAASTSVRHAGLSQARRLTVYLIFNVT